MEGGLSLTECPIRTEEGVKATDVAWVSQHRRASRHNDPVYLIAPEICVEVISPSNKEGELEERKRLYFEKGASEFWLCGLQGEMTFFDPGGKIEQSHLCPDFPKQIAID